MASTGVSRIEGIDPFVAEKAPCKVATTANITLSGAQTVNGVAVAETTPKTRVLVRVQTDATENGIYDVMDTAWVRSDDFDGTRDVVDGTTVFVNDGTTLANSLWRVDVTNPVTFGTTSIAFSQLNAISTTSPANFATLALLKAATDTSAGNLYSTTEHTATYGYEGSNTYLARAVTGGTDDNGSLIKSTGNTAIEFVALFPNGKKFQQWGMGDNTTAATAAENTTAMRAAYASLNQGESIHGTEGLYLVEDSGGDPALTVDTDETKIYWNGMRLDFGTNDGICIEFGPSGGDRFYGGKMFDLNIRSTATTPFDTAGNLTGTGLVLRNCGHFVIGGQVEINGFEFGLVLNPTADGDAVTNGQFGDHFYIESCREHIFLKTNAGTNGFITSIQMPGGLLQTNPAFYDDIVTADCHLIRIGSEGGTIDTCDFIQKLTAEQDVTFKILIEGTNIVSGMNFIGVYLDEGTLSGGTSGSFPYLIQAISGWATTAGSAVLTKTSHGYDDGTNGKIRVADLIDMESSTDANDKSKQYVVTAIDADTITVNKAFSGNNANARIGLYSSNIYISGNVQYCNFIGMQDLGRQVITDISTGDGNCWQGGSFGYLYSQQMPPLPAIGTGMASNLSPHLLQAVGDFNGTIKCYLGNTQDVDSGANVELNGVALDALDRLAAFASFEFNKTGRTNSRPYGTFDIKTASSTGDLARKLRVGEEGENIHTEGASGTENGTLTVRRWGKTAVADATTFTMPDAVQGIIRASANAESGTWNVQTDGTVTKESGTANTGVADSGTVLTVYQSGTQAIVKNRLGAAANMTITIEYTS